MGRGSYTPEQREAASERMKARFAAMSPEERAAYFAKFRPKDPSANAHRQLVEFWADCTGEARAKRCAHLTNPEAQAKSHAAQRTPEFRKRRSAWSKRMWEKYTPEERIALTAYLREASRRKWAAKSPEERAAINARRIEKRRATLARKARQGGIRKPVVATAVKRGGGPRRFESVSDAVRYLMQLGRTSNFRSAKVLISQALHGQRKTALGRTWRFAD